MLSTVAILTVLASGVSAQAGQAAAQDSPSRTYAPTRVDCPASFAGVRRTSPSTPINPKEATYVIQKTKNSVGAWTDYLNNVGLSGFDVPSFVAGAQKGVPGRDMPNVAFAVSGGGERAMLVGGGIIGAFDSRNATAVAAKIGGVQQIATYLVGLSGGSWMTGSWATSGYPTFENLRDQVWDLAESFSAPKMSDPYFLEDAALSIAQKSAAGFNVSYNDLWGRQLSYHLVNATGNITFGPGAATTWNSIAETAPFVAAAAPFPIVIAINRVIGQINVTLTSPIMEFTPYEYGSWDPTLAPGAFIPVELMGTECENGNVIPGPLNCVEGFDNAGFIMAASGEYLGAAAQLALSMQTLPAPAVAALTTALGPVPDNFVIDARIPSPFKGLNPSTFVSTNQVELDLVDGGLAGENVPFTPLIHPERMVDVIIAIDGSADTNNYPDGQEPRHTYDKSILPGFAGNFPFPYFPTNATFQAQGLNKRISFFGSICTATTPKTPLIVYVPNYEIVAATNTSTFTNSYPVQQQIDFFNNGQAIASQSNSKTWPVCLACALVDSQITRNGGVRSSECDACFKEYCYLGTSD